MPEALTEIGLTASLYVFIVVVLSMIVAQNVASGREQFLVFLRSS